MELTGVIKEIGTTQEFGQNGFTKRQLVLETDGEYPQKFGIEFIKDKTKVLDNYNVGENVVVGVNLRSRSYTNKDFEEVYITSLQGWRIVKNGS